MSPQTRPTQSPSLLKWVLGTGLRVLVFGALVVAGGAWADWDAARADPDSGVNILVGLVVFAVEVVVAFVWGAIDGWRRLTFRALAIRWAVVGVVTGGFASAYIQAGPEPLDLDVLFSDLISVGLFEAALVAGAAVSGGALTLAAGRGRGAAGADQPPTT